MSVDRIRKRRRERHRESRQAHLERELARGSTEIATIATTELGLVRRAVGLFRDPKTRLLASGGLALLFTLSVIVRCLPLSG